MSAVLDSAMSRLSSIRPCFHSEADFQFALAWQIQKDHPNSKVRLEVVRTILGRRNHLDLLFELNGMTTAVELKYFKAALKQTIGGEEFHLTTSGANDLGRYDFLKDIMRLEKLMACGIADEAYAIALTNDARYWARREPRDRVDENFGLEEGRILKGELAWAAHTGGTAKGREAPIRLTGEYELNWCNYCDFDDEVHGRFRYLAISAVPAHLDSYPDFEDQLKVVHSSGRTAEPRRGGSQKYIALKAYLGGRTESELTMNFGDINAIVMALPASAYKHTAWWGNHAGNPQAVWLGAGYKVFQVNLGAQQVIFRKI